MSAIDVYRGSPYLNRSSPLDSPQRVKLFSRAIVQYNLTDPKSRIQIIGGAMYGGADPFSFVDPALAAPRAGFVRIERLWQTWLPTMVAPNKASLRDAHMIAAEITGKPRKQAENNQYTSFSSVSLAAIFTGGVAGFGSFLVR